MVEGKREEKSDELYATVPEEVPSEDDIEEQEQRAREAEHNAKNVNNDPMFRITTLLFIIIYKISLALGRIVKINKMA